MSQSTIFLLLATLAITSAQPLALVARRATITETISIPAVTAYETITNYLTVTDTVTVTSSAQAPIPTDLIDSSLSALNITGFLGVNDGMASWFRTNNTADSTNGHSWCSFPYDDSVPGFAPSYDTMMANFGNSWTAAGTAYCGLEAVFTTPSGRNATLYLIDAFADPWVRSPGSIDVVTGVYPELFGSVTTDKNDVIMNVTWQFTGKRNELYKFNGVGSG